MYTPGAVSSLIHLETSSTEKSKEQKKLDKLFGWQKTKSPVDPAPAFASPVSSDVSKDYSLDFNPPDKKKKKLYKNGDVSSLNVKNECLPKNVKEKNNRHEKDENVDSPFLKKVKKSKEKNPTENEVKKNRKRKKNSEEKKSEFFGNEIEKNDEFLSKKKKLKNNEFEKKEEKKVKKLSDKNNNNNNNNVHGQEKSLNSKFSLKGNEINEKEKKKRKNLSDKHNRNNDNNNNVHGQEKALKSKFSIKSNEINTKEENKVKKNLSDKNNKNQNNVHGQEKAVNSKVPVINDVLSALQGKDGLKSRKRNPKKRKEKDLSDLEESEEEEDLMAKKRSKKRKRDKKNDFKTVFVGNLPLTITIKHLKKLFSSSCGEVESVRLRGAVPANPQRGKKYAILKKDFHSKCKSINAYICFCDKQSADKACEVMNGQEVGGQIIRVNSSIIDKKGHDHKRSVFVGNLPFVVTEDDVRKHFLDCGSVVNVRLVKDWKTGIGKGFGYVKFEEVDGAELAVKLDGSKLNKRKIRVYPSEADPKKQKEARDTKRRSLEKTKVGNSRRGGAGGGGDGKNFEKKGKLKKSDQKEFVGIKAEKKKKKKPKHLARKMGLTSKKKDGVAAAVKPVEKSTGGPNKHMVFE